MPFDLAAGADWTAVGPGRVYSKRLIDELHRKARAKAPLVNGGVDGGVGTRVDLPRALRSRTFREFDDAFTAPLHGFRDADDYYAQSSSAPWLDRIAVPTCIVHALDDTFLPAGALPLAALRSNPAIVAHVSAHGGHVGFVHGTPWAPTFFAEQTVARFLAEQFG